MTDVKSGAATISQAEEITLPGAMGNLERNQLSRLQEQRMGSGDTLSLWVKLCLKLVAITFQLHESIK